jgi:hypothetical protein
MHQIRHRVGTFSQFGGQHDVAVQGLGDRLAGLHLHAAPSQHRVSGLRQARTSPGSSRGAVSSSIHRTCWPARPGIVLASRVVSS